MIQRSPHTWKKKRYMKTWETGKININLIPVSQSCWHFFPKDFIPWRKADLNSVTDFSTSGRGTRFAQWISLQLLLRTLTSRLFDPNLGMDQSINLSSTILRTNGGPGKHEEYAKVKRTPTVKVSIAFVHLLSNSVLDRGRFELLLFSFYLHNSVLLLTIWESFTSVVRC